jgi:hypothetical protein
MGGVAEQCDPAPVEGRQWRGQLGDIMTEHVLRTGERKQRGDRLVPRAEEPDQLDQLVIGPGSGGGGRGGVAVDPAVGQRHDAEHGAAPPRLPHGTVPGTGPTSSRQVVNPA